MRHKKRDFSCGSSRRGVIRLLYMRQLVHPFTLSFFQLLLQFIYDDFIHSLGLAIALRVCWGGVSVIYAKITTISPKGLAIELKPII